MAGTTKIVTILKPITLLLCSLMLSSCVSTEKREEHNAHLPLFFIEVIGRELQSSKIASVQLPVSASVIQIKPVPSIPHFQIESVELDEGNMGPYLKFKLKNKMRLQLMRICGEYRGRRLVLVLGQRPLGSWRINKVLEDGVISIYVEYPDESLPELVETINQALKSGY